LLLLLLLKVLNPKSISLFIEFFLELGSLVLLTEKLSSKSKFFLNSLSISFFWLLLLLKSKSSLFVVTFVFAKKSNSSTLSLFLGLALFNSLSFLPTSPNTSIFSTFCSTTGSRSFLGPLSTLSQKLSALLLPYFCTLTLLKGWILLLTLFPMPPNPPETPFPPPNPPLLEDVE
jgi:hypothetical protein